MQLRYGSELTAINVVEAESRRPEADGAAAVQPLSQRKDAAGAFWPKSGNQRQAQLANSIWRSVFLFFDLFYQIEVIYSMSILRKI